jgi:hypothetical protein
MPFIDVPDGDADNMERAFYDFESVPALPDGLDAADRAIMAFAERIVTDATAVTQEDVDELRGHGLDALGVQPDAEFAQLDPAFREALTVGRPIETA